MSPSSVTGSILCLCVLMSEQQKTEASLPASRYIGPFGGNGISMHIQLYISLNVENDFSK